MGFCVAAMGFSMALACSLLFWGIAWLDGVLCGRDGVLHGRDGVLHGRDGVLHGRGGVLHGRGGVFVVSFKNNK